MIDRISARLDRIAGRYAAKPAVSRMSFAVSQPRRRFAWTFGAAEQPYFIASITKLFTVAVIMQLRHEGAIGLEDPVADVLGTELLRGLVVHDGVDYASVITIRQLLSQTSGIPDYYEQHGPDGSPLAEQMLTDDRFWSFEELLERARELPSPFTPDASGRAHYSDTNYQILGRIVETCTGMSFVDSVRRRIMGPFDLQHTWHLTRENLDRYDEVTPVLRRRRRLQIPATLASGPSDGSIVSTTADQLRFLRAFMSGELFPKTYLAEMTEQWKRLTTDFGPLRYGTGLMRFTLPRWQTLPARMPAMVGHSGSFGTVLYHAPDIDLYVAGTVNQTSPRHLPYPLLARITTTLQP
ncbi:serine hydrolase domain-containing protein [Intrasporangium sp.]|uniref:serine hydrolase domain-containing protein n=1 Tax=Intrasporangium sp. TaxID=1925024 RepID=UPI00293A4C38|nr:serine hydrolase domain-containing protein [Intrasporangium sp.]MDV3219990.1 beta-lactamase family protein [Intrasporangium sp.]